MWLVLCALPALAGDAKVDTAFAVFVGARTAHETGTGPVEDVYTWSVRLMEAHRAVGDVEAEAKHATRMKALGDDVSERVASGAAPPLDLDRVRYYQAQAAEWASGSAPPEPVPVPAPYAVVSPAKGAPAATPASTGIDGCFATCDATYQTCLTDAQHYKLGIGDLGTASTECTTAATKQCGGGKRASVAACREASIRTCDSALRVDRCDQDQNLCNARCR